MIHDQKNRNRIVNNLDIILDSTAFACNSTIKMVL